MEEEIAIERLDWRRASMGTLVRKITGGTITGAEPINFPGTDGIIIYLSSADGQRLALDIGAAWLQADPGENPFYLQIAEIPGSGQGGENP